MEDIIHVNLLIHASAGGGRVTIDVSGMRYFMLAVHLWSNLTGLLHFHYSTRKRYEMKRVTASHVADFFICLAREYGDVITILNRYAQAWHLALSDASEQAYAAESASF